MDEHYVITIHSTISLLFTRSLAVTDDVILSMTNSINLRYYNVLDHVNLFTVVVVIVVLLWLPESELTVLPKCSDEVLMGVVHNADYIFIVNHNGVL